MYVCSYVCTYTVPQFGKDTLYVLGLGDITIYHELTILSATIIEIEQFFNTEISIS